MKKLKYLLLFVTILLVPTLVMARENEKIKVNIFKSSTCPHCAEALEFFEGLQEDSEYSNYFELALFETNGNSETIKNNIDLAEKVAKHFGKEFEGVPLIVIGSQYFEGYISSMDNELKDAVKNEYFNDSYNDVVAGLQDGTVKNSNFGAIMTILIFLVIIGGIIYLVYIGRKTTDVELQEENKEIITEEKKETKVDSKAKKTNVAKKSTAKKTTSSKAKK